MVELLEKSKRGLRSADYTLEKEKDYVELVDKLTPKFEGKWNILLLDPPLAFVEKLLEDTNMPSFIDVCIVLPQNKIDIVTLKHPKAVPEERTARQVYEEMIEGLQHMISKQAANKLFSMFRSDLGKLQEALNLLDAKCEGAEITLRDVTNEYYAPNIIYANDVLEAFFTKSRWRWKRLQEFTTNLGDTYAYNALNKAVKQLLADKNKYLANQPVKNRLVNIADAPSICRLFALFAQSQSPKRLISIFYYFEKNDITMIESDIVE